MNNNFENICEFLEWDSTFFGFRIARTNIETLTDKTFSDIKQWCNNEKIDCLYFLANSFDSKTTSIVEINNFHFVDIRVDLEKKINLELVSSPLHSDTKIRLAQNSDISDLRQMASVNHTDSRFYYDGHFPKEKCNELYATWIEQSCNGFANAVFVAEYQNEVLGYVTCTLKNGEGNIGLVGVKENAQGKGIGMLLINKACKWFTEQGINKITVVTQGRNIMAQRLYQKNGFISKSVKLWYHLWLNDE